MIQLDTNAAIAIINNAPAAVRVAFAKNSAAGETIGISSIVLFELRYGGAKSRHGILNENLLNEFLSGGISVLAFDDDDAACAGVLRATLEAAGTPIGPYDILIAGQALRHGATLVTANTREFKRVKGLKIADWSKG